MQAEVDRLEGLVDAEAARADYILDAAEENIDAFAESLHQQNQRHLRRKQAELQRQRQVLARAAAEELVRERRQRMSALREVRASRATAHNQYKACMCSCVWPELLLKRWFGNDGRGCLPCER